MRKMFTEFTMLAVAGILLTSSTAKADKVNCEPEKTGIGDEVGMNCGEWRCWSPSRKPEGASWWCFNDKFEWNTDCPECVGYSPEPGLFITSNGPRRLDLSEPFTGCGDKLFGMSSSPATFTDAELSCKVYSDPICIEIENHIICASDMTACILDTTTAVYWCETF